MKANSADIIKSIRKEMGLSQEDMAEQLFISIRQLARIESGEVGMDVWQFINAMELLGSPTEDFWLLYLDSGEYSSYRDYKHLKRRLSNGDVSEAKEIIADIEKSLLAKQPMVKQFISYAKTVIENCMKSDGMMDDLLEVMYISRPGFEEGKISEYRMTYNEIFIALAMAECLYITGEHNRSISMVQSMINGRQRVRASEGDKAILFPSLYFTLSRVLKNAGKYKEALRACDNAIEACREYNNLRNIPEMLFFMADCYHKLGEEEHIYKTHLVRAYHVAYAVGKNKTAINIKEDALKYYDVIVP
ncbi:MAG: helix-turn-helix domain-containing protein [Defluviitaleaceae bacterium]|nr:helix-turn-helix domain-containing protein [Defluviitaleaceae bacterium]